MYWLRRLHLLPLFLHKLHMVMKQSSAKGKPIEQQVAEVLAPLLESYYNNYFRILHLVKIYKDLYGTGRGRRAVPKGDLLRAAVVFTHAALEALLRGLGLLYLCEAGPSALGSIPLAGASGLPRAEKFRLGDLAKHRGKTVDQVLSESISGYLNQKSFNNTNDICSLLEIIGVPIEGEIKASLADLQQLIRRRHQIVHQADLIGSRSGRGHQRAASLSVKQVLKWLKATREFSIGVTAFVIDHEFENRVGVSFTELEKLAEHLKKRASKAERLERSVGDSLSPRS